LEISPKFVCHKIEIKTLYMISHTHFQGYYCFLSFSLSFLKPFWKQILDAKQNCLGLKHYQCFHCFMRERERERVDQILFFFKFVTLKIR
jgi:hypothetical protein